MLLQCFQKNPDASVRLFCFHHAGGAAAEFRSWPQWLPSNIELHAVQLPGREVHFSDPFVNDFEQLVNQITAEIVRLLDRPCVFFGHSLGAILAFAVIARLRVLGLGAPLLFFPSSRHAPQMVGRGKNLHDLPEDELLEGLGRYDAIPAELLQDDEVMSFFLPRLRADLALTENYRHTPTPALDCQIVALGGKEDPVVCPEELGVWRECTTARFRSLQFEGGHFYYRQNLGGFIKTLVAQIAHAFALECA